MERLRGSCCCHQIINDLKSKHPKGQLTQPQYVADAVFMLSMDEADWINGARLKVDGGEHLI